MTRRARTAGLAGLAASIACVAALHVLRRDLSPAGNRLSEYAAGPRGWLMTVAFVSLGGGLIALGIAYAAPRQGAAAGRSAPALAVLAGVGMVVSGVFPAGAEHATELIHSRASALATVAIVAVALLRWLQERHQGAVDRAGAALAIASAALAAASPILHDTPLTGANQRVLWAVLLSWLLRSAWRLPGR